MSLELFFDAGCTQPILSEQSFLGDGSLTVLNLTAFTGGQLSSLYKETKVSYADISFAAGVGTGFSGLTPDALKGQKAVSGNQLIGQVVSNTADTVTVSDSAFTSAAQPCYLSAYAKLYTPEDFTLATNAITLVVAVATNETIHALPVNTLAMYFGGNAGDAITKEVFAYIERPANFEYTALQVYSDDTELFPYHVVTDGITFVAGVGTGFSGLTVNTLAGKVVNHAGLFRGLVVSNTADSVTLDTTYAGAVDVAEVFNVGSLLISKDGITYAPVLDLDPMTLATPNVTEIRFKETLTIPASATNYTSTVLVVVGSEFVS